MGDHSIWVESAVPVFWETTTCNLALATKIQVVLVVTIAMINGEHNDSSCQVSLLVVRRPGLQKALKKNVLL